MRLLFVCLGNICRSPAAETVLRELLERAGLAHELHVDSAGTAGYHVGEEPDARMRASLRARGYRQWSLCRQVVADDFSQYDVILAMDQQNLRDLRRICPQPELLPRLRLAATFCKTHTCMEVPDPYYGTGKDFEHVLNLSIQVFDYGWRFLAFGRSALPWTPRLQGSC